MITFDPEAIYQDALAVCMATIQFASRHPKFMAVVGVLGLWLSLSWAAFAKPDPNKGPRWWYQTKRVLWYIWAYSIVTAWNSKGITMLKMPFFSMFPKVHVPTGIDLGNGVMPVCSNCLRYNEPGDTVCKGCSVILVPLPRSNRPNLSVPPASETPDDLKMAALVGPSTPPDPIDVGKTKFVSKQEMKSILASTLPEAIAAPTSTGTLPAAPRVGPDTVRTSDSEAPTAIVQRPEDIGRRWSRQCDKPPPGWSCSRDRGHEGPCAASKEG